MTDITDCNDTCSDALYDYQNAWDHASDTVGAWVDNSFGFGDHPSSPTFGDVVNDGADAYAAGQIVEHVCDSGVE